MTDRPPSPAPAASRSVVTRFAPSPTGSLHIGGARTALFNLLYARHCGGRFLIRVEDTDRERSTQANVAAIFDGLGWLGIAADEPPLFQAARADRHREVVAELLARGRAYRDYTSVEDLAAERERARAEGRVMRSPWRDRPADAEDGRSYAIRFKGPLEGETRVSDLIRGEVTFRNAELDDLVLLRSDGAPTYNLAVVVDDHDMGVTHVIRGEDHLNNAARQTLIYQALDWEVPVFAHLPLIHGPDGAKLSKRHGAQGVFEFADLGYLPEGLRNYLTRLGWGHGDDEIFTDAQAAAWFDVADVVKAPARLDWPKLNFVNQQYIRAAEDARLVELIAEHLSKSGTGSARPDLLAKVIPLVKEGAQTLVQLAEFCAFVLKTRPLALDEKTAKLLTEETRARLGRLRDVLAAAEADAWTAAAMEPLVRRFSDNEGVGIGKFGAALRGVMSGGSPAPDLASTLAALGREEALAGWTTPFRPPPEGV